MKERGPGRPARNKPTISPDAILATALDILDRGGADALTMRELGTRLRINPMTIYHHFGDRDGLIKSVAERVYAGVVAPEVGDVRRRIKTLMLAYHQQVVQHPGLTLSIFANPNAFPSQAQRISDELSLLLRELGLTSPKARMWMHILVDFTHGAGIATAMNQQHVNSRAVVASAKTAYAKALTTLLDSLASDSSEKPHAVRTTRNSERHRPGADADPTATVATLPRRPSRL